MRARTVLESLKIDTEKVAERVIGQRSRLLAKSAGSRRLA